MNQDTSEEEIFEAAIEITDRAERSRFLDDACGANAELRQNIESLLQMDDTSGDFLETPAVAFARASHDHQAGNLIGRYRLEERLGEGGFGVVWRAEQLEPVNRRVALKIIKLGMDTDHVIARFEAERQAIAQMSHRHIATVLDAACTEQGRPYFVMELVEGTAIDSYCDSAELSLRERLQLFTAICRAVQHAHQKGIIHRDLKPSNILVTSEDDNPVPKIIDFGIAKAVGTAPEGDSEEGGAAAADSAHHREATSVQLVGTPEYMSPEQILRHADVDTRADVYALGAVLHKILVGVTPVDMSWLRTTDPESWSRRLDDLESQKIVASERFSTLADADRLAQKRGTQPKTLRRKLTGDLDRIVEKALQRHPSDRYDSAAEFARDVDRYLSGMPVVAGQTSTLYHVKKFAGRHRVAVVATAAVLLAMLLGGFGAAAGLLRAERAREQAEREKRNVEIERDVAESARERAERMRIRAEKEWARAESERVRAEKQTEKALLFAGVIEELIGAADPEHGYPADFTVREQLDLIAGSVGEKLRDYPMVEARIRRLIGRVYYNLREYAKAEPHLKRALEIHEQELPIDDVRITKSEAEHAIVEFFLGNAEESARRLRRILPTLRETGPSNELIETLVVLSRIRHLQNDDEEPTRLMHAAWLASQQLHGENHPQTLRYQVQASRRLLFGENPQEAEHHAREALVAMREARPEDHVDVAFTKYHLAFVLSQLEKHEEADTLAEESVEVYRKQLGDNSSYVASGLILLATTKSDVGDAEKGLDLAREACEIADRTQMGDPSMRRSAYQKLAVLARGHSPTESVIARGKSLQVQLDYFPRNKRLIYGLVEFAFRLRRLGDFDESRKAYLRAIESMKDRSGESFQLCFALHELADLHREYDNREVAAEYLGQALKRIEIDSVWGGSRAESLRGLILIDLIHHLYESGQEASAEDHVRVLAERATQSTSPFDLALDLAGRALKLMRNESYEEAQRLLRDANRQLAGRRQPARLIARINGLVADCQLHRGEFELCESALLRSERQMYRMLYRAIDRRRLRHQLIELYTAWGKAEEANLWRDMLRMQARPSQAEPRDGSDKG